MNNEARIKLAEPISVFDKFTYKCAKCGALLFASDNFCPSCGSNVSNCIGVVILKSEPEMPEKSEFTEEDAIQFWGEDDSNG